MKYSKEERLEVGRKIHESGLSNLNAGQVFGIAKKVQDDTELCMKSLRE